MSKKLEVRRQMFHILLGVVIVILINFDILSRFTLALIIIFGFVLSYHSIRAKITPIDWFLRKFERPRHLKSFPGKGALFYLIGVFVVVLLFPKDIAMASVMVLAFGDAVSHLWGIHFGKIKNPLADKKFIEGTITGWAAGTLAALYFVGPFEAMMASLAAMIAEAVEVKIGTEQIDDNLVVPFIAALTIWLIRKFVV